MSARLQVWFMRTIFVDSKSLLSEDTNLPNADEKEPTLL